MGKAKLLTGTDKALVFEDLPVLHATIYNDGAGGDSGPQSLGSVLTLRVHFHSYYLFKRHFLVTYYVSGTVLSTGQR